MNDEWWANGLFIPVSQAFLIHFLDAQPCPAKDQGPREASAYSGLQQALILVKKAEPDTENPTFIMIAQSNNDNNNKS